MNPAVNAIAGEIGSSEVSIPSIPRRMASFMYEGVLLFGVLMISGYLYSALTQMRHALNGKFGLQVFLFMVLAVYFCWFWTRGGQTVAMKAWHIRLVDRDGEAVSQKKAFLRFLLAWMWFLPSLVTLSVTGMEHSGWAIFSTLLIGISGYALIAKFSPRQQFMHDWILGTCLVSCPPTLKAK